MTKKILIWLAVIAFFVPTILYGGATFSRVKTWITGQTLTASDLNAEFDNVLNNLTPTGIDDASTDAAAMRTTVDPYPASTESLPTSLAGELHRLRYMIQQITGMTYWYQDPVDTVWVPANAMTPTSTNGAAPGTYEYVTNDIVLDYLAFDGVTSEFAQFHVVMPENWDLGIIKVKIYWSSATGSTAGDTVEWGVSAKATDNDGAIDSATGSSQVISDVLLANNGADLQITGATPAVTVGGTPAVGKMITITVFRNVSGTDNMTEDAWLFGAFIQFTKGSTAGAAW